MSTSGFGTGIARVAAGRFAASGLAAATTYHAIEQPAEALATQTDAQHERPKKLREFHEQRLLGMELGRRAASCNSRRMTGVLLAIAIVVGSSARVPCEQTRTRGFESVDPSAVALRCVGRNPQFTGMNIRPSSRSVARFT